MTNRCVQLGVMVFLAGVLFGVASGCDDSSTPFPPNDGGPDGDVEPQQPVDWLAEQAVELDGLTYDPIGTFDDLESVRATFEARRVVMLGEGDHGVVEAREYKLRFIAWLYLELGYDVLVEELGLGEAAVINEYIQSGDVAFLENADINDYDSYFRTNETWAFFEGIRALNESRPAGREPLRFLGFDLDHGRRNAAELVVAYLESAASTALFDEIRPAFNCLGGTPECDTSLAAALESFRAASADLIASSSQGEYDEAAALFQNLADTVHYYRLATEDEAGAVLFRESIMMRNADAILAAEPGGLILSAHNLHVARAFSDASNGWETLGEHLATSLVEEDLVSLAFTFAGGQHLVRTMAGFEVLAVDAPMEQSLEDLFSQVGAGPLLVDVRAGRLGTDPRAVWLTADRGAMINGFSGYLVVAPALQWDAFLFVDAVSPTTLR